MAAMVQQPAARGVPEQAAQPAMVADSAEDKQAAGFHEEEAAAQDLGTPAVTEENPELVVAPVAYRMVRPRTEVLAEVKAAPAGEAGEAEAVLFRFLAPAL